MASGFDARGRLHTMRTVLAWTAMTASAFQVVRQVALQAARVTALSVGLCAAASNAAPAQPKLHDDRGVAVQLPAVPQRIVSLLPSLTESVCALGACARLVGTDRYSNWPASVLALPKLGGLDDAQIEAIVALKPDIVLAAPSARAIDRIEALGLTVIVLQSQTHADVHRTLDLLAALLGDPSAGARVWETIERETRSAAEQVPMALRGKRIYFEIDSTPYAAGAASFVGETLTRLGMANAVPHELGPFPKLNPEYVVRAQPDIVIAAERSIGEMAKRPGWSSLQALKQGRTCGFAGERYELLLRPGPRMGEAAALIAECLARLGNTRPR